LATQIKQISEITEVIYNYYSIIPQPRVWVFGLHEWDDMPDEYRGQRTMFEMMHVTEEYLNYYEFQLAAGDFLKEADADNYILINETAAKTLGWEKPLGKSFTMDDDKAYYVKGVLKDTYGNSPTKPAWATVFRYAKNEDGQILVKYQEGTWNACKAKIEKLIKQEYPDKEFDILNAEETYERFLQTENELLKILSFVSIISVIISVFGFFSLISLSCEEKRKEIAIRKINGATMRDILAMYFKTYFSLLIIGAVIAFPIGYYIMKQWLEKYMKQTSIDAWIYLSIIFAMAFVIILCVGWRVYRASVENPAEVLKTE
jgi:ABC-type antimicrobial peptide transport system permease subunit